MSSPFRDELQSALARVDQLTLENQALRRRLSWVERRGSLGGSRAYFALPLVSAALSCGVAIGLFALRAGSAQPSVYADDAIAGVAGANPARPLPVLLLPIQDDEPGDGTSRAGDGHVTEHEAWDVVHRHDAELRRDCWPRGGASPRVTLRIVVAPSGRVTNAVATSDDPSIDRCVEAEARRWMFPAGSNEETPFRFVLR